MHTKENVMDKVTVVGS